MNHSLLVLYLLFILFSIFITSCVFIDDRCHYETQCNYITKCEAVCDVYGHNCSPQYCYETIDTCWDEFICEEYHKIDHRSH